MQAVYHVETTENGTSVYHCADDAVMRFTLSPQNNARIVIPRADGEWTIACEGKELHMREMEPLEKLGSIRKPLSQDDVEFAIDALDKIYELPAFIRSAIKKSIRNGEFSLVASRQ
jgi:hypothetical protein